MSNHDITPQTPTVGTTALHPWIFRPTAANCLPKKDRSVSMRDVASIAGDSTTWPAIALIAARTLLAGAPYAAQPPTQPRLLRLQPQLLRPRSRLLPSRRETPKPGKA